MQKWKELEIGGISFGLTSGVITTIGMIVGIDTATKSSLAVVTAILTIAVADSLSDALGMHLSEESRLDEKDKPIWAISIYTFIGKLLFSLIFIIPIILFKNPLNVQLSVVIGFVLIAILAFLVAKRKGESPLKQSAEHVGLTILVIILSYIMGTIAERVVL